VDELLQSIEKVLRMSRLEQEREALVEELKDTNAQLAQRLKELDLLYHVGKSITMLGEPNRLLERILDAALFLTEAVDGVLVLMDPATGQPNSQVRRSLVQEGYVTPEKAENLQTLTPGLMVAVSLQINGRVLGVLTLSNKRSRNYFDQHDQRMIRMLADYATIALENFRLLAEVQAQQEREKRELRGLFERYVSPQVVEKIVSRPQDVRPGGQRQLVTVMFADLRGFTSFTARSSPEVLITVLNQHMSAAADVILKEEGTLDKFMGDEVMAFFNAPLIQADHALRAIRAGLRILDAARDVHDKLPPHNRLAFGVGISTGEAIVGNVGTPNLMNFTVVGSAVNKAHSLQELAPAGKVLICRQTYELVCAQVLAREMPLVQIKGQLAPEPVYEVVGIPTR
jgi:class 3 adenylate cyclase